MSHAKDLFDTEKSRIRNMCKAMKVFINTDFANSIFNTEGELFPERDITQLDVAS